jgi:hypothetical protein
MSSFFYQIRVRKENISDEIAGKPSYAFQLCKFRAACKKKGIRRISIQMRQTTQRAIPIKKQILHPSIPPEGKYEIKRR